jgi:hypothetical protein
MLLRDRIEVRFLNRDHASENAEAIRETLARYPDGLVPPNA